MLEAEWNEKLRALQQAQEEYERQRQADLMMLDEEAREHVMELSTNFPRLWKDSETSNRDRKRMVRLLLEDVTLIRQDQICAHVRFKPKLSGFSLDLHQSLAHQGLAKILDISTGMPAVFANLATSRYWHISSSKIAQLRLKAEQPRL